MIEHTTIYANYRVGDNMNQDKVNFGQEDTQKDSTVAQDVETKQADDMEVEMSPEEEIAGLFARIAELEAALDASEQKVKDQKDAVVYAQAEVQTMRNRTEQEIDKAKKFALEKFAGELLPVMDNMERAIELADKENEALKPMLEGVELTLKTMKSTVEKFGLQEVNPEGQAFNPEFHQAMAMQESADHEPNTVMFVMQKGYSLNGRIVRPAMVMVSKAVAE